MPEHSILPPSSAARRVACPGSRGLEAQMPDVPSLKALEGNDAHYLAQNLLKHSLTIGRRAKAATETYPAEMGEGVNYYLDYVLDRVETFNKDKIFIEQKVEMPNIHAESWGTVDCWAYDNTSDFTIVHIFDFKYGRIYVDVYENWQLLEYAAGVLNYLDWPHNEKPIELHLHIIQPRYYGVEGKGRGWKVPMSYISSYIDKLKNIETLSLSENAPLVPSKQCQYCKAITICPVLKTKSKELSKQIKSSAKKEWSDEESLANELTDLREASAIIDARLNGLEQEAISLLESGKRVPGYRIERGAGREAWKKPVAEVIALGDIYGVDLRKPPDAITPTQALKLKLDPDVLKGYSERKYGENKLVEDKIARKIFGGKR